MKNIVFISKNPQLQLFPEPHITVETSLDKLIAYLNITKRIGVDTETLFSGRHQKLASLQIGQNDIQFVVDCLSVDISPLKKYLEDPSITKILHNFKFDYQIFLANGINMKEKVFDTFIAECLLTNGILNRSLGLDAVATKYTTLSLDKSVRGDINKYGFTVPVIEYAAADVEGLHEIMDAQLIRLEKFGLSKYAYLESYDASIFGEMEYNGIRLNVEAWKQQTKENKKKVKDYEILLDKLVAKRIPSKFSHYQADMFNPNPRTTKINWKSPIQVKQIFNNLGFPLTSVAEQHLIKYKSDEVIKTYLEYKEVETLVTKFGDEYLKHVHNDRVYFEVWQILETFRVAMKNPNISQIPQKDEIRNCFISDEGKSFIDADFASQELALIADDSQDPVWLEAIRNKWDLHSITADMIYGEKWKEGEEEGCLYVKEKQKCKCKEHKKLRNNIKSVNYGIAYGIGPNKLASELEISTTEAQAILIMYLAKFPTLKSYFNNLKSYGTKNLLMKTFPPFNAIRFFSRPKDDAEKAGIERQSMNTRIQATGATILKYALYLIDKERQKVDYPVRIVMSVHDSIVCEVDDENAQDWSKRQVQAMKMASNTVTRTVQVDVDCQITKFWTK